MSESFLPCKIVDRQWAEKLLDGEVFMRALSEFGCWEASSDIKDQNRKDIMEGAVASYVNPNDVDCLKGLDPSFKNIIGNVTLIDQGDLQFFKVFCLYCLEFEHNRPVLPDSRVEEFGDTAVIFRDFNSFLLRLFKAIESQYLEHVELLDRINYYDINTNRRLNPLFEKTTKYAFQKELRFAFCPAEKNKFYIGPDPDNAYRIIWNKDRVTVNIGDIRDIAYSVPIGKFLDGTGIVMIAKNYFPLSGNLRVPYDYLVSKTREEMKKYKPNMVIPMVTIFGK